jgi:hypothetical protein
VTGVAGGYDVNVLATQPAHLVIDITAVTLLGAAGIHALEDIDRRRTDRTDLALVYTGEPARTVLALCGITDRIPSFTNLGTAITSVRAPSADSTPLVPQQRTDPVPRRRTPPAESRHRRGGS